MPSRETSIGGPNRAWPSTLWAVVTQAADPTDDEGRRALEQLATLYWKPVYFHIRRTRDVETAKDLTQAFFAYLLDHDLVARARPEAGSFRAFLRGILARFLSDQRDHDAAACRRSDGRRIPLDFADAETDIAFAPAASETPEQTFERSWVELTLSRALDRFRDECGRENRGDAFEALRLRFSVRGGGMPYREIAARLGRSEPDVTSLLHRARERLREILVDEVRQSVSDPAVLEEELRLFAEIL